MMKLLALVCAVTLTCTASAFGVHKAGWFGSADCPTETPRAQSSDPLQSEAAMRYRTCQQTNWRSVMSLR